jgi:hypothetical protein
MTTVDADAELGSNLEAEPIRKKGRPRQMKVSDGTTGKVRIVLEENDAIPPTGLFLAHNGKTFLLRPGEEVNVPEYLIQILDHAVMSTPVVDQDSGQVTGYRDRMRYPYRIIRSPPGK